MARILSPAVCALALLLAACQSKDEVKPSPIPANALAGAAHGNRAPQGLAGPERGERIDKLLAVVEGRPLFRSTLIRRLGIDPADVDDPDNRVEIERETQVWAKEQLFEKAAERIGLRLQASKVDAFVERRLQQELDKASKEVGEPVSRKEYLASEGLTWAEYREKKRGELTRQLYLQKMFTGIGSGTRPMVDLAVSPAEVRRIYREHRAFFDEQAGARLAEFRVEYEDFEDGTRDDLEVEELATQAARRLAADFQRGMQPAALAKKYELGEPGGRWAAAKADQFVSRTPDPAITAWMGDPARRPGDTRLLPLPVGIRVLGVIETRPARQVPFEEAYPKIVEDLTLARQAQLESETLIDLLSKGRVVWPETLADALVLQARGRLAKIQEIDYLRGARLR